jgi:hypothetical protein
MFGDEYIELPEEVGRGMVAMLDYSVHVSGRSQMRREGGN